MKRYLWVVTVLIFVGANASENPFNLSTNLKKIDQDQDVLLSEFRDMAKAKEKREEIEDTKEEEEVKVDAISDVSEEDVKQENEAVTIQPTDSEEEKIKKIKEEQIKIDAQRAENEKIKKREEQEIKEEQEKAEQERLAAEKLEVEKYEAQRVAKKKREEELARSKSEKEKQESEKLSQVKQESTQNKIVDINITFDEAKAKKEADKAYEEAVAEMDKEG